MKNTVFLKISKLLSLHIKIHHHLSFEVSLQSLRIHLLSGSLAASKGSTSLVLLSFPENILLGKFISGYFLHFKLEVFH